jgi:DNA invertase Pin-like site-specific DNA recombinase
MMIGYGSVAVSIPSTEDHAIPTPQATCSHRDIISDIERAYYRRSPIQLQPLTQAELQDLNDRVAALSKARGKKRTTTPAGRALPGIDTAEVVRLHRSGQLASQIATQLGCTDNTVRRHLNKAGETRHRRGSSLDQAGIAAIVDLHKAGCTTAQITHQLGFTRITIHKYLDRGGYPRRESRAPSLPGAAGAD